MRVVAIIQARMGSTRLPGKVLMDLCGKPVLQHVVERVRAAGCCDEVVVATSWDDQDLAIADWCRINEVRCYRGEAADNVIQRFWGCAESRNAEIILRVCADCPLLDSLLIFPLVAAVMDGADYAAYRYSGGGAAIGTGLGITCEALTFETLCREAAIANGKQPEIDRKQHVTQGIYANGYVIKWLPLPYETRYCAIDTYEDLVRVREMMTHQGAKC